MILTVFSATVVTPSRVNVREASAHGTDTRVVLLSCTHDWLQTRLTVSVVSTPTKDTLKSIVSGGLPCPLHSSTGVALLCSAVRCCGMEGGVVWKGRGVVV